MPCYCWSQKVPRQLKQLLICEVTKCYLYIISPPLKSKHSNKQSFHQRFPFFLEFQAPSLTPGHHLVLCLDKELESSSFKNVLSVQFLTIKKNQNKQKHFFY